MASLSLDIIPLPHHAKSSVSTSRARYRAPRHEKAVKVYTISQESTYLLIQDVPTLGISEDLRNLCDQYGIVEKFECLENYPCEAFTEVYLVKYKWFPAARVAKRQLDEKAFFGTVLHVCYAPEYESLSETREKLGERRKFIASKTKTGNPGRVSVNYMAKDNLRTATKSTNYFQETAGSNLGLNPEPIEQPVTYIWAGKEYTTFPSQQANAATTNQQAGTSQTNSYNSSQNPSVLTSEMNIKKRLSKFNVPNSRVSFKRRKKI